MIFFLKATEVALSYSPAGVGSIKFSSENFINKGWGVGLVENSWVISCDEMTVNLKLKSNRGYLVPELGHNFDFRRYPLFKGVSSDCFSLACPVEEVCKWAMVPDLAKWAMFI